MNGTPTAAGFLLALLVLAGAGLGAAFGQPSAGTLGGLALGLLLALLFWLRQRGRPRG
jgi:energy-converting hydrogenase Eha subunit B